MTGEGQPPPPPGWYADPDGTPGMVRWWNGAGWSDVAVPTGPGVAVQSSPVLAPSRPEVPGPSPQAQPPRPRSRRGTWLALGALAVVVAVVIGLVVGTRDHAEPAAAPVGPPGTGQLPSGPTFGPDAIRIVDHASGISYPYLDGWQEFDLAFVHETSATAGQYYTTQDVTPAGDRFIAQVTSGPVREAFGWTGPGGEAETARVLADSVRGNYYPGPNEQRILRDEPRTVDGRAAHLVEFQLSWDVEGYDATGERAALLVIDVGRPAPALLYVSIPNTHAELYGVIDALIGAVEVL